MKITKRQLKRIIREAQWGNFTGGAAPLDDPISDTIGPLPREQLKKLGDIMTNDMGMSPEEILQTPEFREAGIEEPSQLHERSALNIGHILKTVNHLKPSIGQNIIDQLYSQGISADAKIVDIAIGEALQTIIEHALKKKSRNI